jgi:UDP-glucose 4-epimerase
MNRYFITGGAGFIGSNLAARLISSDPDTQIVVYDNLKSGSMTLIEPILNSGRLHFIKGDIHDVDLLVRSMSGCNVVVHLAANPDISMAETDPSLDFREGTALTQNVLEAARCHSVSRFLFTSGSGVYGDVPGQIFSESYGPCLPVSPYGAAKLGSEALISAYCHMFGMSGVAFRFANVVGPNQTHGVGFDFIKRLRNNSAELRILGDGTQCKSYIYISDVLDALELTQTKMSAGGFEVYNVATSDYITVTEIAKIACDVVGVGWRTVRFLYSGGDRGWNGDVPRVLFDTAKIRALGWSNRLTSRQAIERSLKDMFDATY